MEYLHTMVRVTDLDQSLDFYCGKFGLVEMSRIGGRERTLHFGLSRRAR